MEHPSTKEREVATLYLIDLNGMKKNGDENSDLLCFYAIKLPIPKPAQHTPLWTQVHRIAILIQHTRSSWDYLYAMLAAGQ